MVKALQKITKTCLSRQISLSTHAQTIQEVTFKNTEEIDQEVPFQI